MRKTTLLSPLRTLRQSINSTGIYISSSYHEAKQMIHHNDVSFDKLDLKCEFGTLKMDELGRFSVNGEWLYPTKFASGQAWKRMTKNADINYMFDVSPDIRCVNYNWWHNRLSQKKASSKVLVRTVRDPITKDREIRAILGHHYSIIDDTDILDAVVDSLPIETELVVPPAPSEEGHEYSCLMRLDRFDSSIMLLPIIKNMVKLDGLYDMRIGRYISICNSEVGKSSVMVAPTISFCGMAIIDDRNLLVRIPHVGKARSLLKEYATRLNDAYADVINRVRAISTLKLDWARMAKQLFKDTSPSTVESFTHLVVKRLNLGINPPSMRLAPSDVYLSELLYQTQYMSLNMGSDVSRTTDSDCPLNLTQPKVDAVVESVFTELKERGW